MSFEHLEEFVSVEDAEQTKNALNGLSPGFGSGAGSWRTFMESFDAWYTYGPDVARGVEEEEEREEMRGRRCEGGSRRGGRWCLMRIRTTTTGM